MKKLFFITLCILLVAKVGMTKAIDSKIDSVIVYKNSALIKRIGKCNLTFGENKIIFTDLPDSLINNSIQIELQPSMGKILDVKIEDTYLFENKNKIKELRDKIELINNEIKVLEEELKAINNYTDFLKKLSPFVPNTKITIREIQKYIQLIEGSLIKNHKNIAEIKIKIENLKNQKQTLENELALMGGTKKRAKNIIVYVNGLKKGPCEVAISYLVNNVKWNSNYDLYVDTANNLVSIDYFASILQNSGEDWDNAKIIISTATPVFGRPGKLSPWYVDIYKPRPLMSKRVLKEDAYFQQAVPMQKEFKPKEPEIKEETISFSFRVKNRINIPSDSQPHRIYLTSKSLTGQNLLSYKAIPKLSPYVYLTSTFNNPFNYPIFPGKAKIYLDGKFVGTERFLKTYPPDDKMNVFLGIDNSLSVEKKLIKKFTEYSGLMSKSQKITYEYEINITNGKNKDVKIIVEDNYPVSLNEKIKVDLIEPKKRDVEITKDGIIKWNLILKPRSKKSLNLKFNIEYPKDIEVSGIY